MSESKCDVIALFASEPGKDGKTLDWEMVARCRGLVRWLCRKGLLNRVNILVALSAYGFNPPELCSMLVREELERLGVEHERIIVCGDARSTVSEIRSMEITIELNCGKWRHVGAASTWYHVLPRVPLTWWRRHGRIVRPILIWKDLFWSWFIWRRALLEFPKTLVALLNLPAETQDKLGKIVRRTVGFN